MLCANEKCHVQLNSDYSYRIPPFMEPYYLVCTKCQNKWYDDGYGVLWWDFYISKNYDLADKFLLDFLGKLG